jgi:iron complex outermembrane receptor protein
LLVLLAAAAARAQGAGESIEVVGERLPQAPNAPASQTTVIDAEQFGGEVRSVSELLLAAPGVTVHPLGGPGQASTLSLRGATADESLVLLDGIPLQGPGGGAIDLSTLPATLLSRLIVTRGVLGAQLGAGALGGAVELVPKRAGRPEAGAHLSYGSFNTGQITLDGSTRHGGGDALLAIQADHTDGDFDYARQLTPNVAGSPYYGFTRENADATRGSVLARTSQPLGDLELDGIVLGTAGDRGLPGPTSFTTTGSRELDAGALAGLRIKGAAGSALWSLRAFGRIDRIQLRGVQEFGDCQDGTAGCPRQDERSSGGRAQGQIEGPLGESIWLRATGEGGADFATVTNSGSHSRAAASIALAADAQLTSALAVHPAVRLDRIGSDTGLSPALTAALRPSRSIPLELRAGWGLSFRAPTFDELYLEQGGIASNPDLQPERAWSVDAGATWRTKALFLSAGAFYSRYSNLILYEQFTPAEVKPFNAGEAHVGGAEVQATLLLPHDLTAEASYSYLRAIDDRPGAEYGQPLAYRPPHRLFVRLARSGDRFEGYSELAYQSAMPRNPYGTAFQNAQLVFNAGAGARVAGPLWIDVEVKNLLDDQTLEDLFQYPLPSRSIAVIARARL